MATTTPLRSYGRVLGRPGALAFSTSALFARMPMAMVSLGIVLLVVDRTDSYALAGAVSAAFLIANASFARLQARLIDQLGQSRVLPLATLGFSCALVAVMALVELDRLTPWSHLAAAVAGASLPQVGSSVRARWSHLVEDKDDLHTAFAFESVVDELVFILGPALVTVLATVVHPLAGLSCAVVAAVAGTAALVRQKETEPPAVGAGPRAADEPLPWQVLGPLMACAAMLGAMLGSAEVATVAFADERAASGLAGPLLAIWGIGSLVSGLLVGAARWQQPHAVRLRYGMIALALLVVPLPFVHGIWALAACLFVSGFAISPTLIASFAWIEHAVPSSRLTEGLTLFTTALAAGLAPGAMVAGLAVDATDSAAGYLVVVVTGLLGAGAAVSTSGGRRRRLRAGPDPVTPKRPCLVKP